MFVFRDSRNRVAMPLQCPRSVLYLALIMMFNSCKKFIDVDPLVGRTTGSSVYASESSAIAALTGIYTLMSNPINSFATGDLSFSILTGLSSDELALYSGIPVSRQAAFLLLECTSCQFPHSNPGTQNWPVLYNIIYRCNSALEGIESSATLRAEVKHQLFGEAFIHEGVLLFLSY